MNWSYHQTFEKVIRTIARSFSSPAVFFLIASLSLKLLKQAVLTFLRINPQEMKFRNKEGLTDFNFCLPFHSEKEGVSVMLRVKNEEQKIISCLKSMIDVFDAKVLYTKDPCKMYIRTS